MKTIDYRRNRLPGYRLIADCSDKLGYFYTTLGGGLLFVKTVCC